MAEDTDKKIRSGILRIVLIGGILFLLGSHLWDYHPFVFIFISLFLIDWKKLYTKETLILVLFLLSVYVTWFFLNSAMLIRDPWRIGQGILLFTAYALGKSVDIEPLRRGNNDEKILFYLLFGFFIAYMFSMFYSYLTLPAEGGIDREGMFVCFQNEYCRLHVHGGNLVSTIIAYNLTLMAILLPFILFFFHTFREKGFYIAELLLLSAFSLFALYLAVVMQRRTVLLLFAAAVLYTLFLRAWSYLRTLNLKTLFILLLFFSILSGFGYLILSGTPMGDRLMSEGLHDSRFSFWKPGIEVMLEYPWGGGHHAFVGKNMCLAHNTWIDIGKDFGVIPFVLFVLFSLFQAGNFFRTLVSERLHGLMKHLIVFISLCLFAVLMIEPVFTSDKIFLAYTLFFFALVGSLYRESKRIEV